MAPPPPPPPGAGESSCTTLTDDVALRLLVADTQVSVKVSVSDPPLMTGLGSVMVRLPLVGRMLPAHPSLEPPPELEHVVAFGEDQVSIVDCPVYRVIGEAARVTVTGAQSHSQSLWGVVRDHQLHFQHRGHHIHLGYLDDSDPNAWHFLEDMSGPDPANGGAIVVVFDNITPL